MLGQPIIAVGDGLESALVDEAAYDLLDEEGVALGLRLDRAAQRLRQ